MEALFQEILIITIQKCISTNSTPELDFNNKNIVTNN